MKVKKTNTDLASNWTENKIFSWFYYGMMKIIQTQYHEESDAWFRFLLMEKVQPTLSI